MAMQGQPPSPPPIPPKPPTPPASAGVTTSQTSCAQPTLLQMNVVIHYDQAFDQNMSFMRSIKVFVMSYIGFDQLSPQLYQQKLQEYVQAMSQLYGVTQMPNQMMQTVNNWLAAESYYIVFDVAYFRHRPGIQSARIRFTNQMFGDLDLDLDPAVGRQNQKQMAFQLTFNQLHHFRVNNVVMTITLELVLTGQQQPITVGTFDYEFGRVHAEGFYDWIRFGNEEQVLLNTVIECEAEQVFPTDWVVNYHMHSLIWALRQRLESWRALNHRPIHQSVANRTATVLYRNYVDPNSEAAFWSDHPAGTGFDLQRVRFMDLQMGLQTTDYFASKDCLCSEWCNWNAFFNYNPIYRFLFIRHSQTYLQYKVNKPEIYMYAVAIHLCYLRKNLAIDVATPETPLLRLLAQAINYKELFYSELFLKDPQFRQLYPLSYPPPHILSGATYLILRASTPVYDLCYQSDTEPFGDNCVNNFINYCLNLAKLHRSISAHYVSRNDLRNWRKEMDEMLRNIYSQFLPFCCIYTFGQRIVGSDLLFDMRTFSNTLAKRVPDVYVRQCRKQIVRIGSDGNPLNSQYKCQPVVHSLVSCHRLIQMFEETIGKSDSRQGIDSTCDCYVDVDGSLAAQIQLIFCDFYVNQQWLTNRNLKFLEIPLTVCYTLKLYAIIHNLQLYFCQYMFAKRDVPFDSLNDFELIFDNQLVEQTLSSNHYIDLFTFNDMMRTAVGIFYDNYWGKADHMTAANPDSNQCLESALFEHQRTYFWWRNGGDQRFKFVQILTSFEDAMNDVLMEADIVFKDYILSTTCPVQYTYDYTTEVLDYLVYYLVKAICYTIFRTAREMHKKLYEQEVTPLVANHRMYALSRPGYTPIFRTLRTVLATLENVGQKYALFDDEAERIADTITETKSLVRNLYKKHYYSIGKQFYEEIHNIYHLPHQRLTSQFRPTFGVIHFANGFGFLAALIDEFRTSYRHFYKLIAKNIFHQPVVVSANMPWQVVLQSCRQVVAQYLNTPDAIELGQPLMHPIWQNTLTTVIADFNQGTEQNLNINLAAANI